MERASTTDQPKEPVVIPSHRGHLVAISGDPPGQLGGRTAHCALEVWALDVWLARDLRALATLDAGGVCVVRVETDALTSNKRQALRVRHWMDLLAAVLMAAATVATAFSAYQATLWNGEQTTHKFRSTMAMVTAGKLSNFALQRTSVHVTLFVHWLTAVNTGERRTADYLFIRFPEPLKTATQAWQLASSTEKPSAPLSPFDMPQYLLQERIDSERWERIAQDEAAAAEDAGRSVNRYMLFTIIYASVLFFSGISGKFRWLPIDVAVLVLGAVTLVAGVATMIASPRL